MKIVFIARYLPQHGSIIHCYALAKRLIDRGHDVHMVSGGTNEDKSSIEIFNDIIGYGMKHHKVGFPLTSKSGIFSKLGQLFRYIITTPKVLFIFFKLQPDVLHVHYPVTSYLTAIYRLLTGKKFITTHHISGVPKHPLHRKADYVIAISNDLKEELHYDYDYSEKQIRLIFNGVSIKKFHRSVNSERKIAIKNQLDLPIDKIILGFIGSYINRKGLDILLEAMEGLEKYNFHIVLVGEGNRDWIESLVAKFKLEESVTLYPFQDPIRFYEIFDIFVLPSRKEGFPLVSLEAMMMGIPTIRSDVEGAQDQIDHGVNGYLFKNENSHELKQYIKILLNSEKLRKTIGEKARKKALNEFSEDNMVKYLLEVYRDAANK